jgi:hypothetical protein
LIGVLPASRSASSPIRSSAIAPAAATSSRTAAMIATGTRQLGGLR